MVRPLPLLAVALMAAAPCPVSARPPVDPVELLGGREVPGDAALALTLGRFTYVF